MQFCHVTRRHSAPPHCVPLQQHEVAPCTRAGTIAGFRGPHQGQEPVLVSSAQQTPRVQRTERRSLHGRFVFISKKILAALFLCFRMTAPLHVGLRCLNSAFLLLCLLRMFVLIFFNVSCKTARSPSEFMVYPCAVPGNCVDPLSTFASRIPMMVLKVKLMPLALRLIDYRHRVSCLCINRIQRTRGDQL